MKSVFWRLSKKEFEEPLFRLIGEYAGAYSGLGDYSDPTFREYYRLVFRTTKRRQLGAIMLERVSKSKTVRKRLVPDMWRAVVNEDLSAVRENLKDDVRRLKHAGHNTTILKQELAKIDPVENYLCSFYKGFGIIWV